MRERRGRAVAPLPLRRRQGSGLGHDVRRGLPRLHAAARIDRYDQRAEQDQRRNGEFEDLRVEAEQQRSAGDASHRADAYVGDGTQPLPAQLLAGASTPPMPVPITPTVLLALARTGGIPSASRAGYDTSETRRPHIPRIRHRCRPAGSAASSSAKNRQSPPHQLPAYMDIPTQGEYVKAARPQPLVNIADMNHDARRGRTMARATAIRVLRPPRAARAARTDAA